MKIQTTFEVPDEVEFEGEMYEPTGEFREAEVGEPFLRTLDNSLAIRSYCRNAVATPIYRKKKWIPDQSETFYFVSSSGTVVKTSRQYGWDDDLIEYGNYFMIKSDADILADRIRDTIRDFRDEVGL